ncbi:MAG: 30S ribosomal protein S2 [Actinomycetota bacterium]|nr:30S ribosomal protein S2 [Actinomycetota bacterium]
MPVVTMKQLLESGVHFGHQTRWNPKMKRFIFGESSGIYVIDLQQTLELLERAHTFVKNVAERGGTVMFVGTKKQCQDSVREQAIRAGMPYVSHRWLGGLLTNWSTISQRIRRLHELRAQATGGQLALLPTRERLAAEAELVKLEANLGGVSDMQRRPDAVVILDLNKEMIGVREANRLGIPVVGLVDTNCDPDEASYIIPGNDDAIRSCSLILSVLADGIREGKGLEPAGGYKEARAAASIAAAAGDPDAARATRAAARAEANAAALAVASGELLVEAVVTAEAIEAVAEAEAVIDMAEAVVEAAIEVGSSDALVEVAIVADAVEAVVEAEAAIVVAAAVVEAVVEAENIDAAAEAAIVAEAVEVIIEAEAVIEAAAEIVEDVAAEVILDEVAIELAADIAAADVAPEAAGEESAS